MKARSSFSCGLFATARDCRPASAANSGDVKSGTQISKGSKPCRRSRSRPAVASPHDDFDRFRPMSGFSKMVYDQLTAG